MVKPDFAEKKINDVANKYLDQALDSFTSDLSKPISPTGGAIDIHKAIDKLQCTSFKSGLGSR